MRIAVLGTGLMGAPMAVNLLKAGHAVTVWNRSKEKTRPLVDAGAHAADTPAAAVAGAEVVLVMLTDGAAVADVLFRQGAAEAMESGALVIDTSSIAPAESRTHAARLGDRGVAQLDAPVSGGPSGAESASLAIMVGGDEAAYARGQPVLEALGRPTHVGPPGAGSLAKLSNQIIVALAIGAVAEGLLLADEGGADAAQVREAMRGGFADSKILQIHGERMLERSFLPGGAASLHLKDLRNALEAAREAGLRLPLAETIAGLFEDLVAHEGGGVDHSGVLLELERRNAPARLGTGETRRPE